MDALNILRFIIVTVLIGHSACEQSAEYAKLLQRIEALEHKESFGRSKLERLERRVNAQSRVTKSQTDQIEHLQKIIESQSDQIKSLQDLAKTDNTLSKQVVHVGKSHSHKIKWMSKMLHRNKDDQPEKNVNSDTADDNLPSIMIKNSSLDSAPVSDNTRQTNQSGIGRRELTNGNELLKRQPAHHTDPFNVLEILSSERAGVSFSAYLDHDLNLGNRQTIKFNKVIINDGNGYNIHTGTFTCPESGVYMFSFFVGQRSETSSPVGGNFELVLNSQNVVYAVVDVYHNTQNVQGGNMVIKRLQQGDSVWIDAIVASHVEGSGHVRISTFSGVYLYP